ncbi:ribosome small subunit-dependent GTPase A [Marinospirillum sp.]|uniref:ribosome small subunit-dependent GTPase A n=1 Tax=Marinospirillum sp. TaxID=2183934 RepID=UPI0028700524|nr:ribosome small subunit-dependent GTPase A [Marinospirillum sp.]MDR9468876.1 ribosome small subunit-dependent GTPase A [Marinospirillum sp.]
MNLSKYSLAELGWRPFFLQQLSLDELESFQPARVFSVNRNQLVLRRPDAEDLHLPLPRKLAPLAPGDWVLLDENLRPQRLLERQSLFSRKAAGSQLQEQLIAANVDTALIVCALNDDFSLNRIERYLVVAREAGVQPVVILTWADHCELTHERVDAIRALDQNLDVLAVNALKSEELEPLNAWCSSGQTLVLLGSSGVGKTTLARQLTGQDLATGAIRLSDSKGRHTTAARSFHPLQAGGWLLDTPGMRELQLPAAETGVKAVFSEITALAEDCFFRDCQHQEEPGCAVLAAIESGDLDSRRLEQYHRLLREQAQHAASLSEKRKKGRELSKVRKTLIDKRQ